MTRSCSNEICHCSVSGTSLFHFWNTQRLPSDTVRIAFTSLETILVRPKTRGSEWEIWRVPSNMFWLLEDLRLETPFRHIPPGPLVSHADAVERNHRLCTEVNWDPQCKFTLRRSFSFFVSFRSRACHWHTHTKLSVMSNRGSLMDPPSDMESQFSVIQGWDLQYSAWPLLLRMRVIRSWFGPGTTKYKEWHAPLVFGCAIKEWSFRRFTYGNLVTTFTSSKQKDADDKTVPARASAPERARSIAVSSRNNASRVPVAIAVMKPHDPVYGRYSSLPSCSIGSSDGRCVQRAGTYSTSADDGGLLGVPRSRVRLSKLYPNHEWVSSDLPNTCLKASHLWSAYAFEWTFMHVCLSTHPV